MLTVESDFIFNEQGLETIASGRRAVRPQVSFTTSAQRVLSKGDRGGI